MKRSTRNRLLAFGIIAVAAAGTKPITTAHAEPSRPDVPSSIAVEEGHKVFLVGHAVGVQIYSCTPSATGFAWSLLAPRANLYSDGGKLVASHFGGPTWQARDGSTVRAQRRGDPVTVDSAAIPWLLLSTVSTSVGADGDRLARTAFIQRTATTGGLPPAPGACNAGTADTTAEVPYTADYHFWKTTGRSRSARRDRAPRTGLAPRSPPEEDRRVRTPVPGDPPGTTNRRSTVSSCDTGQRQLGRP